MTPESIVQIGQTALYVTIQIIGVLLVPALIVGLLISVFQAATQINEVELYSQAAGHHADHYRGGSMDT